MQSRFVMASCILAILGSIACMFPPDAGAAPQDELPDLCINPEDVRCFMYQGQVGQTAQGTPVAINVTVRNLGPGSSDSASVSFFIDGAPVASVPLNTTLLAVAPGNSANVGIAWDTSNASIGSHIIRVVSWDERGDADYSNNNASVDFSIISVPELTFTGSSLDDFMVTVGMDSGVLMYVRLTVSIDLNWTVVFSPELMIFNSNGSQPLKVVVILPQGALNSVYGELRIDAHGYGAGFDVFANISGIVAADPYFRVSLETDSPVKEIPPGGEAVFTIRVRNEGNAVDSYTIEIVNFTKLSEDDWIMALSTFTLSKLQPDETRKVRLTVTTKADFMPYKVRVGTLSLKATSQNALDFSLEVSQTIRLVVNDKGFNPQGVSLMAVILLIVVVGLALLARRRRKRASGTTAPS